MLIGAAFCSQNAVVAADEAAGTATGQALAQSRAAENKWTTAVTETDAALEAVIKDSAKRKARLAKAAEKI